MVISGKNRNNLLNQKIELLAPAGSFESLKAAISNGADAVYLGGGKLNARVNAANFTQRELVEAFDYAHERGRRVYITLNTLIKDQELSDAVRFAEFVYKEGADAVIVQDMGLVRLLKEKMPGLEIHASTQMTLSNSMAVKVAEKIGVSRVVLPRELTLQEIENIKEQTSVDIEVFVHGALCVCYSGQCLMSSFIGRRSGNRGLCAQPCRLPWSLSHDLENYTERSYLLSPRDIMAIELLPQLKKAGVSSLKLEGRMKSPEYVAIVTSIYRKYIDMLEGTGERDYKVKKSDKETLMQAFNRGGFSRGYLEGNFTYKKLIYPEHPKNQGVLLGEVIDKKPLYIKVKLKRPIDMGDGIEIRGAKKDVHSFIVTSILYGNKHVRKADAGNEVWVGDIKNPVKPGSLVYKTLSKPLFNEARKSFEGKEIPTVPLNMEFSIETGKPAVLKVSDSRGNLVTVESGEEAREAINLPLSEERIKEQLAKTGDTPYYLGNLLIRSDNNSNIPISALNAMRREALDMIKSIRIQASKKPSFSSAGYDRATEHDSMTCAMAGEVKAGNGAENAGKTTKSKQLTAFFHCVPDSLRELNGLVSRIYLPITVSESIKSVRQDFSGEIYVWAPSIMKDPELLDIKEKIKELSQYIDGVAYGELGVYKIVKEELPELFLCAEPSMNIFNSETKGLHGSFGAKTAVLSPELNYNELKEITPTNNEKLDAEAIVYGRIPLMTMEHCPSSLERVCTRKCHECTGRQGFLKDRKNEKFHFVRDPKLMRTQVFNAHPTFMDDIEAIEETPVRYLRLVFTNEDSNTRSTIIKYYRDIINGNLAHARIIDSINQIKEKGFTKGHWFRGVE